MHKKFISILLILCSAGSVHAASSDNVFIKEFSYETKGGNAGLLFLTLVKDNGAIEGSSLSYYLDVNNDNFKFVSINYSAHTPLHVDYDLKNSFRKITAMNTID